LKITAKTVVLFVLKSKVTTAKEMYRTLRLLVKPVKKGGDCDRCASCTEPFGELQV